MNLVRLNESPVIQCGTLSPFVWQELEIPSCKNAALRTACEFYGNTPISAAIQVLAKHLNPKFKHVLVDVKLHNLKQGDCPCLPGWHIDGGPNIESEYVLCTVGSSLTEFNTNQFTLPYNSNTKMFCQELDLLMGEQVTSVLNDWQIVKYNNLTPHRGAIAFKSGKRLLIRVMGSNKILPQPIDGWEPLIIRR